MKKTIFIKNAAILTVSSLVLRFAGIVFKVWLAAKIGAEGIGLYQLVFSVYMFAATFATSGICTAVTRLVSEELAIGSKNGVKRIISRCAQLSCGIAVVSILILFFGSDYISINLLHEPRASLSLKILGFSLPFMGVCSCIKGYFIARRKASPSSVSQLLEQAVRIAVVMYLVTRYNSLGLAYVCAAIILGDTVAEAVSCLYVYLRYLLDFKKINISTTEKRKIDRLLPQISHIALPITLGRYINSLLRMIENVLVPICLTSYGANGSGIALFGMIKGMALPLLFFPSTLLGALSTLLLPEISEAAICGKMGVLQSIIYRIIKTTSIISIIFSALFFVGGKSLGILIYKSPEVGFLLSVLSPIVPFMYLDAISDGILKGLDQQKFTFFTSVGDSAIRIILILLFLKRFGIYGFIGIMYFSNFFTAFLNIRRLIKSCGIKFDVTKCFFIPVCCAFTICLLLDIIIKTFVNNNSLFFVFLLFPVAAIFYLVSLCLCRSVGYEDLNFILRK